LFNFFTSKQPNIEHLGKNKENQLIGRTQNCLYYIHKGVCFLCFGAYLEELAKNIRGFVK